jgi:hypothetical protein
MPKAKRPKAEDEFNIDELANSPALYGIEEAYQRFTTGPQLVEKRDLALAPESGTPELHTGKGGAVNSGARSIGAPSYAAVDSSTPILTAPELTARILTAPSFPPTDGDEYEIYPRREFRPIPANTVQDGHTHGQQAVYSTIWLLGKPYGQNARAVAIGERTLPAEVPMSYSSLQDNVRALLGKHSIEIRSRGPNKPKLYGAYSYDEILRQRRALGLTHVIRRTT